MATLSGTNASVKLGTVLVADMANWTLNDVREALKAPIFGDTFNKVHGMGTRNVNGTVTGFLNVADSTGQEVMLAAYEAGTAVDDFRLYIDATVHFLGTEVYITSYNTSAEQDAIIPVEFSFEVSENWTRVDV